MKRIKIRFADRDDSAAILDVLKHGRVYAFRDNVFIVPEAALDLLDKRGAKYENLGEETWDRVVHALRTAASSKV